MSFGGADGVIWGHTVPFAGAGGRVIKKARVRIRVRVCFERLGLGSGVKVS